MRFYPNARDGDFQRLDNYTIDELDAISERLVVLRVLINDFGRCTMRLRVLRADGTYARKGTYRLTDVLIAKGASKSGKGGTIVREGPRAAELYTGTLYG